MARVKGTLKRGFQFQWKSPDCLRPIYVIPSNNPSDSRGTPCSLQCLGDPLFFVFIVTLIPAFIYRWQIKSEISGPDAGKSLQAG